jgi:hypothetical protein
LHVAGNQYLRAWNGVLKYRLIDRPDAELAQLRILETQKPNRIFAWPSESMVQRFVERDYRAFGKLAKSAAERHWRLAEREGALSRAQGSVTLRLRNKHDHFLWPHVEAVFYKLAILGGGEMSYDSFWLPAAFVTAFGVQRKRPGA